MAAGKKRRRKPRKTRRAQAEPPLRRGFDADESRPAVATTVAWMLCQVATVASLVIFAVTRMWLSATAEPTLQLLARVWAIVASILALLTLILTVVVWRVRLVPPPRGLTWAAVVISLAALAAGWLT